MSKIFYINWRLHKYFYKFCVSLDCRGGMGGAFLDTNWYLLLRRKYIQRAQIITNTSVSTDKTTKLPMAYLRATGELFNKLFKSLNEVLKLWDRMSMIEFPIAWVSSFLSWSLRISILSGKNWIEPVMLFVCILCTAS